MEKILVIGIAGGTGSGKTTLMNNLIAAFQKDVTILSHDNYYKLHDDLTYDIKFQSLRDKIASGSGIGFFYCFIRPVQKFLADGYPCPDRCFLLFWAQFCVNTFRN